MLKGGQKLPINKIQGEQKTCSLLVNRNYL